MKLNKPTQKAKLIINQNEAFIKDSNAFAQGEFQKLQRKKLAIPVKLFQL